MATDVMIVEDSVAIRKILKRMLGQVGSDVGNVFEAGNGAEALELLSKNPVQLILSDINMPVMDGIQLLTELRSRSEFEKVPIVMITTEGGQAKVLEAIELGASGYVRKPFSPEQIKETLLKHL